MADDPRPAPKRRKSIRLTDAQLRAALRQAATKYLTLDDAPRPVVLTGLMGVGKTAVARRLAQVLRFKLLDSDTEIEKAAGMKVAEIFERYGETHFRERERAVIARLLQETKTVVALGGGAFIDDETRTLILAQGRSVWLRAPVEVLVERTGRKNTRPLLKTGDPHEILTRLLAERTPFYEQANIHVSSGLGRLDRTVLSLLNRAISTLGGKGAGRKPRNRRRRRGKGGGNNTGGSQHPKAA